MNSTDDGMDRWTARALVAKVQSRELRAVDATRFFIDRIERLNPALNAIVQFDPARAIEDSAVIDARLARGEMLPLAGLPFTVKDNLWVQGRRISQGSLMFADFSAPRDAWVVARMKALGAVVLGITNCSEFACKGITTNLLYGPTRHPLDARLTPGGSSGGAASALAAGLGLVALGTDAGGSVRRPAAHCGLVGLKPTYGVVPHPWGFAEPNYGLSVVGLLARNAGDCAWLFDHLLAYDAADAAAPPLAVALAAGDAMDTDPPRTLRIGWSPRLGCGLAIDADVLHALDAQIGRLRAAGWCVDAADPAWPQGVREYPLIKLQHAGLHALYGARLATERERFDPDLAAQIEAGAACTPQELAHALRLRERIAFALATYFERHDLLLCPSAPVTAWPLDQLGPPVIGGEPVGPRGHAAFTPLFNYCGVPACSVPAGLVRGLPVGLQIVAPRFEDARVLQMAALIERLAAPSAD